MRDLQRSLIDALERGREQIVCQVVETRGSTPQKAGAIMVVDPEGGQLGTLGGGCVEAEVKQKAIRRIGQAGTDVQSFVLDHDYAWADGLICGGKMVITVEAIRGDEPLGYLRSRLELLEAGLGLTEGVVVDPDRAGIKVGSRFLFDHDGMMVATWPSTLMAESIKERPEPLNDRPKPGVRGGIAYLPTLPRIRLMIIGGGHVGQAVAALATQADFDVWVVDDRQQYVNAERFPNVQRMLVGPLGELLPTLDVTPQTFALIVTRGHGHDEEALFHLAESVASYVGMIGSRRKIRLIFDSLRQSGISEEALSRVAAPVGVDIGSQSVTEIAVSIVAELIARRNLGLKGALPRLAGRTSDTLIPASEASPA